MVKSLKNMDTSNNTVFAIAKNKNQGNYHTDHLDNKVNLSAKHLVSLVPCGYRFDRGAHNINGLIVIDKPSGITSNACLTKIKKILNPKKLGHTGTLDGEATGVLVCLLGTATKSQDYLMKSGTKTYEAEILFGALSDTEDVFGNIDNKVFDLSNLTKEKIENVCKNFIGEYNQIPPMYSSKKIGGKKLLNLARKGEVVDRKPCKVNILEIKVLDINSVNLSKYRVDIGFVERELLCAKVVVKCSKGTYIRTLAKDIGEKLGVGAIMGHLRRISTSGYDINEAITLNELEEKVKNNDYKFLKPCLYRDKECALTFGKFETLHIGHQLLIKEVSDIAKKNNIVARTLIIGENLDSEFLTKEQRISKLNYMGIDETLELPLIESVKNMSPEDFVSEILVKQLKVKFVVVGSDCSFGKGGIGDAKLLKSMLEPLGIKVIIYEKIKVEDSNIDISSTLIHNEKKSGNIKLVNKLLGK